MSKNMGIVAGVVLGFCLLSGCSRGLKIHSSGGKQSFGLSGGSADSRGAKGAVAVRSAAGCSEMRYKFLGFHQYTANDLAYFGNDAYRFGDPNVPMLRDGGTPAEFGAPRTAATQFVVRSLDCGDTWERLDEKIEPISLHGQAANNGALHFAEETGADFYSRGFTSDYSWDSPGYSIIYPVFWMGSHWAYQQSSSLAQLPAPIIGDNSGGLKDNFYSPAATLNDDGDGSVFLYFGGWRKDYTRAPVGRCPNDSTVALDNYHVETCRCALSDAGLGIDACTGDKIFVATNSSRLNGGNRLDYRVYQGGGSWSANGRDSTQFEPVISGSRLNQCHDTDPESCAFPIRHTNDPTVVRLPLPDGTNLHLMYFSGETPISADAGANYTHVALSGDGVNWGGFKTLRAAPGVVLPGGLSFNDANGSVRAFFSPGTGMVYLMTQFAGDAPGTVGSPETNKIFVLTVNPAEYWKVVAVRKLDKVANSYDFDAASLSGCAPGTLCATASPYSAATPADLGKVHGFVDGLSADGSVLGGWACGLHSSNSIDVHLYAGGPAGVGSFVTAVHASLASEPAVAAACQSNGSAYRFLIPISADQRAQFAGQGLFVHGISQVGKDNLLIDNSGAAHLPASAQPQPQPQPQRGVQQPAPPPPVACQTPYETQLYILKALEYLSVAAQYPAAAAQASDCYSHAVPVVQTLQSQGFPCGAAVDGTIQYESGCVKIVQGLLGQ